jgi:hypothetical protein
MNEPQPDVAEAEEQQRPPEGDSVEGLSSVLAELREIAGDLLELSQVQVERARIGLRSGLLNAGLATWVYLAAIATTVVAVYFLIDGLAGGLSELFGAAWAGRLSAGLLVLAGIGVIVIWARFAERRTNLKRLRRKFSKATEADERRTTS